MKTLTKIEYAGEASIIDRDEFARLIRAAKSLFVTLFPDDLHAVLENTPMCTSFKIPATQAIESLTTFRLDAFKWKIDSFGDPTLGWDATSITQQRHRRREAVIAEIFELEGQIARRQARVNANPEGNQHLFELISSGKTSLAARRSELLRLETLLACTPAVAA